VTKNRDYKAEYARRKAKGYKRDHAAEYARRMFYGEKMGRMKAASRGHYRPGELKIKAIAKIPRHLVDKYNLEPGLIPPDFKERFSTRRLTEEEIERLRKVMPTFAVTTEQDMAEAALRAGITPSNAFRIAFGYDTL
jgi:hypothetical protein